MTSWKRLKPAMTIDYVIMRIGTFWDGRKWDNLHKTLQRVWWGAGFWPCFTVSLISMVAVYFRVPEHEEWFVLHFHICYQNPHHDSQVIKRIERFEHKHPWAVITIWRPFLEFRALLEASLPLVGHIPTGSTNRVEALVMAPFPSRYLRSPGKFELDHTTDLRYLVGELRRLRTTFYWLFCNRKSINAFNELRAMLFRFLLKSPYSVCGPARNAPL